MAIRNSSCRRIKIDMWSHAVSVISAVPPYQYDQRHIQNAPDLSQTTFPPLSPQSNVQYQLVAASFNVRDVHMAGVDSGVYFRVM